MQPLDQYLQHIVFFKTNKGAQQARVLHYNRLEINDNDKYSSFLGPFISNEEKEVW